MLNLPIREISPDRSVIWATQGGQSSLLDYYRLLRTRLRQHPLPHKTLVVTSACPSDGKSTVCINLAGVMAQKKLRVAIVDCDLRKSRLGSLLGVKASLGLTSLLDGAELEEVMFTPSVQPNLSVLLAGPQVANPVDVLDSEVFGRILARLRDAFDYVILDAPPVLHLADFPVLERQCDATAFVVRPGYTNRSSMYEAMRSLSEDKFAGIVVNQNVDWWMWRSANYYSYNGYYGNNYQTAKSEIAPDS